MKQKLFNRLNKYLALTALSGIFLLGFAPFARAANPEHVDIHVSISNAKNLTVDSTSYNYGALAVNSSSVTATPIIVTNPITTGLVETYTIKGDTATADAGGIDWVLAASTGTDQYSLSAQFGNTRPNDITADWAGDELNSTSAVTATSTILGNGTPSESGAGVLPSQTRKLWLRIRTPNPVTDPGHHKVTLTLSVL